MASRGKGATISPRPSRSAGQYKPLRRVTQSRSKGFFQTPAGEIEGLGLGAALDRICNWHHLAAAKNTIYQTRAHV